MNNLPADKLKRDLAERRTQNLFRERMVLESPQGVAITVDGQSYLSFCSNDYLGLANHPIVVAALRHGAERYGVGSGASHLITGHCRAHHALEEELADFVGAQRALLFSTGYMANLGVVTALTSRHSLILEDKLNHASLIDAARLSRARVRRYAHGDANHAASCVGSRVGDVLIVSDGVFSMDGDVAPLAALAGLAKSCQAWLLIDDAHGLGVTGANGRGTLEEADIGPESPVVLVGTLGKAFGTFGAFVAGDAAVIETLIQNARTYAYTTALPPAIAEATRVALRTARDESWRRESLHALIRRFRQGAHELGLPLSSSNTAIQPVILGSSARALDVAQQLRANGLLVPAIRPPTVPTGSARLRITFSAAHEERHVDQLLSSLADILRDFE